MEPIIMSYFGDLIQNLPQEAFDVLSLVLLVVLVVAIIIGAVGLLSSLLDIAMYAVFITAGIVGLFFLTDYVDVSGAIDIISSFIELVISLL